MTTFAIALEAMTGADSPLEVAAATGLILVTTGVGLLIAARRPGIVIGWLLLASGLVLAIDLLAAPYGYYGLLTAPGALPAARLAVLWNQVDWPTLFVGVTAVAFVFPDGRLPSARWRGPAALAGISYLGLMAVLLVSPDRFAAPFGSVSSPLPTISPSLHVLGLPFWLGTLASLVAAAWSVRVRFPNASRPQRLQLLWFAYGALLIPLALVVCVVEALATGAAGTATLIALSLAILAIPVCIAIAILRYGLFDIELVISRTLVFGTLTLCVVATYVAAVSGVDALIHRRGVGGLIATGLVAAGLQPLRLAVQGRVDRLVYGDRHDPYAALARLSTRLQSALASDQVVQTIVDSVAEALKLPYVAVEFARGDRIEVAAARGHPAITPAERVRLTYQGQEVGQLVVAPAPGRELGPAERRLLENLADQAGIAVRAVRLTADLKLSRERLVATREEERRRLRRDLHDGLGPTLAGMALQLDAVRNQLPDDETAAATMLGELRDQTREAITDIRRLVYELRPPSLDELGLVGALREHVARLAGGLNGAGASDVSIAVDAPPTLPPLPAAVEVAAYRIALEALNNVVRHAHARHCVVHLAHNGELSVEVRDDGCGVSGDRRPGVGLGSMRERAAEVGGSLEIEVGRDAGTRVCARLPLENQ
ncbi:MAG: sensor histidine kinase [Actinomycetota bacterium]|nr:sensor histidine kinase [Actinomycetota bacterium]